MKEVLPSIANPKEWLKTIPMRIVLMPIFALALVLAVVVLPIVLAFLVVFGPFLVAFGPVTLTYSKPRFIRSRK